MPEESTHESAISTVLELELMIGVTEERFEPALDTPRGQTSTVLVRLLALVGPTVERPANQEEALTTLVERGILQGDADGNLNAGGELTRGQAASLLVRLIESVTDEELAPGSVEYDDFSPEATHASAIGKLTEIGILQGFADNTFRSGQTIRRDQFASVIARTYDWMVDQGLIEAAPQ